MENHGIQHKQLFCVAAWLCGRCMLVKTVSNACGNSRGLLQEGTVLFNIVHSTMGTALMIAVLVGVPGG
jgi:hypothetical protein